MNKMHNMNSALSEHSINNHSDVTLPVQDFILKIIQNCPKPVETQLAEAAIKHFRPYLNRKHEDI